MSELPDAAAPLPVIWLVDDSPTNRAVTERSLGDAYRFEQFADGSDVVERLAGGGAQPDLVLLDWVMPGMSGDEVCRFLRAHPATRELPVILVTASRLETGDVVEGLAVGANDYVARPFAPEELRARVRTVLRAKQLKDRAERERARLATINQLGRALFVAGPSVARILGELSAALTSSLCDGCSILLLPGDLPAEARVTHHRADPSGAALAAIAAVADPAIHGFDAATSARATLPPAYHPYVERFGLRGLAILPFPVRAPVQGVVTLTRDGTSTPFEPGDIATIETCIEYASLAVQNAVRFDAERAARAQLHAVVHTAPVGIVVTDTEGQLLLANLLATELVPGIDQTARLARVLADAGWVPTEGPELTPGRGAASQARTEHVVPATAGAPPRIVTLCTVPLRSEKGVIGSVMTLQDVTAERAHAAERDRVAQFQEQMLGIVGHDLRNPLGAVVVGAELIGMRGAAVPEIAPLVQRILTSAGRMARIVGQLLDVTRVRLGNGIPLALTEVSLVEVARSVVEELAFAYPQARLELTASTEPTGIWDADRLGQVISNLVSNAIQYGRVGAPVWIEISSSSIRATLRIINAIRDAPLPAERLATMFEPYQRGGDSAHHHTGLGLGLFIVDEIVRAHRGEIRGDSSADGTVFSIDLPRQR